MVMSSVITTIYLVITRQSNPPISQFETDCNEFKSVSSMFPCYYWLTINLDKSSGYLINQRNKQQILKKISF